MRQFKTPMLILVLVLALSGIGALMIYSSSAVVAAAQVNRVRSDQLHLGKTFSAVNHHSLYLRKQLIWFALGLVAMMMLYGTDYNQILRRSRWICLTAFLLLLAVYIPGIGHRVDKATRWIRLGPMTFQPSELAKLAVVIATAKMLSDRRDQLRSFGRGFLQPLAIGAVFVALIAVEDLGCAIVLTAIIMMLWFIAGIRLLHLIALAPVGLAALAVGIAIKPYRLERLVTFFHRFSESDVTVTAKMAAKAWQADQSLIAVGTGGWTGLGPGMGIQKYYYLPAVYTDYIYANICEELGFIGAVALLLLLATLCFIGFREAYKSPDFIGALLVSGLTAMIAVPVVINVGVVLGWLPTKGLALPFISYGGSSLLINMCAMGILMNVAQRNEELQGVKRPVAVTPERRLWKWGRTESAY